MPLPKAFLLRIMEDSCKDLPLEIRYVISKCAARRDFAVDDLKRLSLPIVSAAGSILVTLERCKALLAVLSEAR
jgi:hypothetical protein